jgi:hypothetical protein
MASDGKRDNYVWFIGYQSLEYLDMGYLNAAHQANLQLINVCSVQYTVQEFF